MAIYVQIFPSPKPQTFNFKWTTPPVTHPLEQTMEQKPHRECERTKLKQKQNQVTPHSNLWSVLMFDLAHKQGSGIINSQGSEEGRGE